MNLRPIFAFQIVLLIVVFGSCKPRNTGQGSNVKGTVLFDNENQYPLPVMYHFGNYKNLSNNGNTDQFSPQVWQKITGAYVPHRKGLYVAIHPSFNERYAASIKTPGGEPWVMGVAIKPECLKDNAVLKKIFKIDLDPDFRKWSPANADYLAKNCPYETTSEYVSTFSVEGKCEQILEQYIRDRKFRIIHDEYWYDSGFWIVRDPTCIADMKASPEEVLNILAQPMVWNMYPYTSEKKRDGEIPTLASFYIMLSAFVTADHVAPIVLQDLAIAIGDGDNTKFNTLNTEYKPPIPYTAYAVGRRIIDAAKDCQIVGNTKAFNLAVQKVLDDVNSGQDPEARLVQFSMIETQALPCKPTIQQYDSYRERYHLRTYGSGRRLARSYWSVIKAKGDVQSCIKEIRPNSQCYLDREDPQQFACNAGGAYSHDLPHQKCVASLPMEYGFINWLPATIMLTEISDADRPAWYEFVVNDSVARSDCAKIVKNFFAGTRCYDSQRHKDHFYCGFLDKPFDHHWKKTDCIKIKAGPKEQRFLEEKNDGK
ncbi:MAG: hypothetical protein NT027_16485 [Proteobacteria bacterium]|nr:hypothetical protein [Pseudomonadota bacterium]